MPDSADARLPFARRSFLARLGAATAALGATFGVARAAAQTSAPAAPAATDARWQPTRHPQDDWFDQVPGRHRFFFDTTTTAALTDALQFIGNYYQASKSDYALESADLAVILGFRHNSAPFAFNDAMWKKYGATLAARAEYVDPKTKETPVANPFTPTAAAGARARGLAGAIRNGVRVSVCNVSAQGIAGMIARAVDGKRDEIYKELAANMIDNARLVPAGILAVNRAQERGYSIT
jgi:hypothetical protein